MSRKFSLIALSALLPLVAVAPASAEKLGQSDFIQTDDTSYVPQQSLNEFLRGGVQQQQQQQVDDGSMSGGMQNNGMMNSNMPMNNGMDMNGGMQQNSGMMSNGMSMNNGMGMNGGMQQNNGMMNNMQNSGMMNNNMMSNGMGNMGGLGTAMSMLGMGGGGGDPIGNAVTAAAAIGLGAQAAMNSVGDALHAVGFGGGFHGLASGGQSYELSPFGGTGLGGQGPGRLFNSGGDAGNYYGDGGSSGGGGGGMLGGVGRAVTRAVDNNVGYATRAVTNKLLWGGRGGGLGGDGRIVHMKGDGPIKHFH